MAWKGGRLARRWENAYRRTSIQMILSASFTAVAVLGMVFMGLTLFLRFSSTSNAQQSENSQRVLAQVNLNLDAYLRSMMRVSDAAYYHVIKDLDLAEEDPLPSWSCSMRATGTPWCPSPCFPGRGDCWPPGPWAC